MKDNHWNKQYENAFVGVNYEYTNFNSMNGLKFVYIAVPTEYEAIKCYNKLKRICDGLFCIIANGHY